MQLLIKNARNVNITDMRDVSKTYICCNFLKKQIIHQNKFISFCSVNLALSIEYVKEQKYDSVFRKS